MNSIFFGDDLVEEDQLDLFEDSVGKASRIIDELLGDTIYESNHPIKVSPPKEVRRQEPSQENSEANPPKKPSLKKPESKEDMKKFESLLNKSSCKKEIIAFDPKMLMMKTKALGLLQTVKTINSQVGNSSIMDTFEGVVARVLKEADTLMVSRSEEASRKRYDLDIKGDQGFVRFHQTFHKYTSRLTQLGRKVAKLTGKKGKSLFMFIMELLEIKVEVNEAEILVGAVDGSVFDGKHITVEIKSDEDKREMFWEAVYYGPPGFDMAIYHIPLQEISPRFFSDLKKETPVNVLNDIEKLNRVLKIHLHKDELKERAQVKESNEDIQDGELLIDQPEEKTIFNPKIETPNDVKIYSDLQPNNIWRIIDQVIKKNPSLLELLHSDFQAKRLLYYFEPGLRELIHCLAKIIYIHLKKISGVQLCMLRLRLPKDKLFQTKIFLDARHFTSQREPELVTVENFDYHAQIFEENATIIKLLLKNHKEDLRISQIIEMLRGGFEAFGHHRLQPVVVEKTPEKDLIPKEDNFKNKSEEVKRLKSPEKYPRITREQTSTNDIVQHPHPPTIHNQNFAPETRVHPIEIDLISSDSEESKTKTIVPVQEVKKRSPGKPVFNRESYLGKRGISQDKPFDDNHFPDGKIRSERQESRQNLYRPRDRTDDYRSQERGVFRSSAQQPEKNAAVARKSPSRPSPVRFEDIFRAKMLSEQRNGTNRPQIIETESIDSEVSGKEEDEGKSVAERIRIITKSPSKQSVSIEIEDVEDSLLTAEFNKPETPPKFQNWSLNRTQERTFSFQKKKLVEPVKYNPPGQPQSSSFKSNLPQDYFSKLDEMLSGSKSTRLGDSRGNKKLK